MNLDIATVFIASSILFLLLVILVVLFVLYYQKRLLMQKMRVQNMEADFRMDLLKATIETQEKEQLRLARDLHDDVGPLLTATQLQVRQVKRFVPDEAAAAPALQLADEMLLESVTAVRRVSHNLVPPTLERYGLTETLEAFIHRFSESDSITFELDFQDMDQRPPQTIELEAFRLVQELVNNTIKHAKASAVHIGIAKHGDILHLNYSDNGKGFDRETVKHGLGLKNIENRVALLRGTLSVETSTGRGFQAQIRIPCHTT